MMLSRKVLVRELDIKLHTAADIERAVNKARDAVYEEFRQEQSRYEIITTQMFDNSCGELMVLFNCEQRS